MDIVFISSQDMVMNGTTAGSDSCRTVEAGDWAPGGRGAIVGRAWCRWTGVDAERSSPVGRVASREPQQLSAPPVACRQE